MFLKQDIVFHYYKNILCHFSHDRLVKTQFIKFPLLFILRLIECTIPS